MQASVRVILSIVVLPIVLQPGAAERHRMREKTDIISTNSHHKSAERL